MNCNSRSGLVDVDGGAVLCIRADCDGNVLQVVLVLAYPRFGDSGRLCVCVCACGLCAVIIRGDGVGEGLARSVTKLLLLVAAVTALVLLAVPKM